MSEFGYLAGQASLKLAEQVEALTKENATLRAQVNELREIFKLFANKNNWAEYSGWALKIPAWQLAQQALSASEGKPGASEYGIE